MTRMAISQRLAMRILLNILPQKVRQGITGRASKSRGSREWCAGFSGKGGTCWSCRALSGYLAWISTMACELPPPVTTLTRVSPGLIAGTVASTVVSFTYLNEILAPSAMDPKEKIGRAHV